jgi:hypothetical protein
MTKEKIIVTDEQFGVVSKRLWEIQRRFKEGTLPFNYLDKALQQVVEGKFNDLKKSILTPVLSNKIMLIEEISGGETSLSKVEGIFEVWKSDQSSVDTKEASVKAFEFNAGPSFAEIFGSFRTKLNELCFTKSQIIRFCKKYPQYLQSNGNGNYFLFKENNKYFVVDVSVDYVYIFRFNIDIILGSVDLRRVFVPINAILKC